METISKQQIVKFFRSIFGNIIVDYYIENNITINYLLLLLSYYVIGIIYYHNVEKWDTIQCILFSTITAATIGYGSLHPTNDNSRVFTSFYMIYGFISFFLISSNLASYSRKLIDSFLRFSLNGNNSVIRYRIYVLIVIICFSIGMIGYTISEKWKSYESFYFVIITMATIGYGDQNITNESSYIFTIFYVLLTFLMLSVLILYIEELYSVQLLEKQMEKDIASIEMIPIGTYADKLKDRDNFVLQMLLKMNVISIEQINPLIRESLMQRNTNTSLSLKSSFDTSMPSASRSSTNPLYVHKL